jgi:formylglycine-generating enzyme required for sulfatase activity
MSTVFISYSQKDKMVAAKVKATLEANDIKVTIDYQLIKSGDDIQETIKRAIRATQVTLSIVSKNSLSSDWVALETMESFAAEEFLEGKRFIACYIDDDFREHKLLRTVVNLVDEQVALIDNELAELEKLGIKYPSNLLNDRKRRASQRQNLPDIIDRLKRSLTLDISEEQFDANFQQIINMIKDLPEQESSPSGEGSSPTASIHQIDAQGERSVAAEIISAPVITGNFSGGLHIHTHTLDGKQADAVSTGDKNQDNTWTLKFAEAFDKKIKTDKRQLDERFVQLTLMLDRGEDENERWQRQSLQKLEDLLNINEKEHPVMVILGAPGSGKSTLLRRLELDYQRGKNSAGEQRVSFFAPLNRYQPLSLENKHITPQQFLESIWNESYQEIGLSLENVLEKGEVLLLLDAINELPHGSKEEYHKLLDYWRQFAISQRSRGNRVIFSCRSLDYSQSLSRPDLRVPNVELQPLTKEKIAQFLQVYLSDNDKKVLSNIEKDGTLDFYNNPFFLSLLCEQIGYTKEVPRGRVALFTGFVRNTLRREMHTTLFASEEFLTELDQEKLNLNKWAGRFQLPDDGPLPEKLSYLAYEMQQSGKRRENKQVCIDLKKAVELVGAGKTGNSIIKGGLAISVLDKDVGRGEVTYYHQLLQEYFAGRRLATDPKPELVSVEWRASEVRPSLEETIAGLANGDPLPPPGQTGWEETTLAALPMSGDPEGYIARLMEHNLPLAARCAISPEVKISEDLKNRIRRELIGRTEDMRADLRARIAAGEALGLIADPRFEVYRGADGECLLPPMVDIPGGTYPIGDDHSGYGDETPAHTVELKAYQIGVYPVTNAEYARFIEAGGYEDERWWDTVAAKRWRREGGAEDQKQALRDDRWRWQNNRTDDQIRALVGQKRATEEQVEGFLWTRNSSNEEFERQLDEWFPAGNLDRTPRFWEDASYNNPEQPVVGVSWYEARAYCKWISQVTGVEYRLPTEVEYEAAASGEEGREYCYGKEFDFSRCNTFESHIRRPTPVGIFDNRTAEGAYDLTGNVWTWTTTINDQEKYRYPYRAEDGREDAEAGGGGDEGEAGSKSVRAANRVVRGGGWLNDAVGCRSAIRNGGGPGRRSDDLGFRLSRTLPLALFTLLRT